MRRVFQYQADRNLEPNYVMLNSIHKSMLNEINTFSARIPGGKDISKPLLVYIVRLTAGIDVLFYAGCKNFKDLYSQADGSEDWQLIKYYTQEIIPNTEEKCQKSYYKISKPMKQLFASVNKANKAIPVNNNEINSFLKNEASKVIDKKTDESIVAPVGHEKQLKSGLGIDFGMITNFIKYTFYGEEEINDDYNLAIAAPNYKVLRMMFNMSDATVPKTFRKLFLIDGIKTNMKLYNPPNVMKSILRKAPTGRKLQPMIPLEDENLVVDARDLLHEDILKKKPGAVMIRLISHHMLSMIKENFVDSMYWRRVELGNGEIMQKKRPVQDYYYNDNNEKIYQPENSSNNTDYKETSPFEEDLMVNTPFQIGLTGKKRSSMETNLHEGKSNIEKIVTEKVKADSVRKVSTPESIFSETINFLKNIPGSFDKIVSQSPNTSKKLEKGFSKRDSQKLPRDPKTNDEREVVDRSQEKKDRIIKELNEAINTSAGNNYKDDQKDSLLMKFDQLPSPTLPKSTEIKEQVIKENKDQSENIVQKSTSQNNQDEDPGKLEEIDPMWENFTPPKKIKTFEVKNLRQN